MFCSPGSSLFLHRRPSLDLAFAVHCSVGFSKVLPLSLVSHLCGPFGSLESVDVCRLPVNLHVQSGPWAGPRKLTVIQMVTIHSSSVTSLNSGALPALSIALAPNLRLIPKYLPPSPSTAVVSNLHTAPGLSMCQSLGVKVRVSPGPRRPCRAPFL